MSAVLTRELGLNHADFYRLLPKTLNGQSFQVTELGITLCDERRRLMVRLAPERVRQIASLHIPVTEVTFEFHGYSDEEMAAFMSDFEHHYQRGGG